MPRVNLIGSSNRQTNSTCVFGSMAGLAPTATVRPHITGSHGYKSARVAINSFNWDNNAFLNQQEKDNGCGFNRTCADGKMCVKFIGNSLGPAYYPGKKMLS